MGIEQCRDAGLRGRYGMEAARVSKKACLLH